jgi:hypothetical protein
LAAVGENPARAFFLLKRNVHPHCLAEALLEERWVPRVGVVLGDQDIGNSVAGDVDEAQVWVFPVLHRQLAEGAEARPAGIEGSFKETGRRRFERDQIEIAVARDIEKLLASAAQRRGGRPRRNNFGRTKSTLTEIGLVKPGAGCFGEHARNPLAVEIDKAVGIAVDSLRKVGNARCIELLEPVPLIVLILQRARRIIEGRAAAEIVSNIERRSGAYDPIA